MTNENTIMGRALVECTSAEGTFYYEPYFKSPRTLDDVNASIKSNGGKVTGFRYTNVVAVRFQSRNWVADSK